MDKNKLYKHPQYGHVYGIEIRTPVSFLVWPYLKEPRPGMVGDDGVQQPAKYEATFAIDKDGEGVEEFISSIEEMTNEMCKLFNDKQKVKISGLVVMKDGDEYDHEKYPYYKNRWVLTAKHKNAPNIFSNIKNEEGEWDALSPEKLLGGMLVRGYVRPLVTARGVSYQLVGIRFIGDDGTRFGGGVRDVRSVIAELDKEDEEGSPEVEETEEEETPTPVKATPKATQKATVKSSGGKGKQAGLDIL